jgi:hypothetical protein
VTPEGVGLLLARPLPARTIVAIKPQGRAFQRLLLARVIHVNGQSDGWLHGCELAARLEEAEVRQLLACRADDEAEEAVVAPSS